MRGTLGVAEAQELTPAQSEDELAVTTGWLLLQAALIQWLDKELLE